MRQCLSFVAILEKMCIYVPVSGVKGNSNIIHLCTLFRLLLLEAKFVKNHGSSRSRIPSHVTKEAVNLLSWPSSGKKKGILQSLLCLFLTFHRRRDGEGGLDSVFGKIKDVVLASQALPQVTAAIQGLSDLIHRNRHTTLVLTQEQFRNVRDFFTCHIAEVSVLCISNVLFKMMV